MGTLGRLLFGFGGLWAVFILVAERIVDRPVYGFPPQTPDTSWMMFLAFGPMALGFVVLMILRWAFHR